MNKEVHQRSRVEGSRQVSELFRDSSVFVDLLLCILKFSFIFTLFLSEQAVPLILLFVQAIQQLVLFIFGCGQLFWYVLRVILQFLKSLNQITVAIILLAYLRLLFSHYILYLDELLLKSIINLTSFIQVFILF